MADEPEVIEPVAEAEPQIESLDAEPAAAVPAAVDPAAEPEPVTEPAPAPAPTPTPAPDAAELAAAVAEARRAAEDARQIIGFVQSDPALGRAWQNAIERARGTGQPDPAAPAPTPAEPAPLPLAEARAAAKQLFAAGREDEAMLMVARSVSEAHTASLRAEQAREREQRTRQEGERRAAELRAYYNQEVLRLAETMPPGFVEKTANGSFVFKDQEWHKELLAASAGVSPGTPLEAIAVTATIAREAKRQKITPIQLLKKLFEPETRAAAKPAAKPVGKSPPQAQLGAAKPKTVDGPVMRYVIETPANRK